VSTVAFNVRSQGGKGDVPRTLAICEMLAADNEDMVVKALSWALRELVPFDSKAVGNLSRHTMMSWQGGSNVRWATSSRWG